MLHNAAGSTLLVKVKQIFKHKNKIFLTSYNLTSLDMYNGLSQVYFVLNKKEESISIQRVKND